MSAVYEIIVSGSVSTQSNTQLLIGVQMNYSPIFSRFTLWLSATVSVFISATLTKEYESQFYATQDYTLLNSFTLWTSITAVLITLNLAVFAWTMKAIIKA